MIWPTDKARLAVLEELRAEVKRLYPPFKWSQERGALECLDAGIRRLKRKRQRERAAAKARR